MKGLLGYELKKLLGRRIVLVSFIMSLLLCGLTVCAPLLGAYYAGNEVTGSMFEEFLTDKAYQKALSGREIDVALIREMQEAYRRVPWEVTQYSYTEEYQKYARPYSAVFSYVRAVTGFTRDEVLLWEADMESFQELRQSTQEKRWESYLLTEKEKAYWRMQEEKVEKPVIFFYTGAYSVLLSAVYTVGIVIAFVISICLAGAFHQEHVKRTDQLILSSKHGRKDIFRAKFSAGLLFALVVTVLLEIFTILLSLVVYGTEGFQATFQLEYPGSSLPVSVGQAMLIAYSVVIFVGLFMGAFVMMLSETLQSNVGTLAIAIGMIVLPMMFSVPEDYRVLGQLWSYLPGDFVAIWSIFNPQAVTVGKVVLNAWQIVPLLYTMLIGVFWFLTKIKFIKYQVGGR